MSTRPKAYSYVRMSTDAQMFGDSLRRQLEKSKAFALAQGWDFDDEFELEDMGVSAFRGANLTGGSLGKFLEAVRAEKIKKGSFLLVESLDRLTRQKLYESMSLLVEILGAGINVVSVSDGQIYSRDARDHDLIKFILIASRANEESEIKSFRLSQAWANKRAQAAKKKMSAKCPAWLQLSSDRQTFELRPDRVAVVRRIFNESVSGIGNYSIMRRLNTEKIPSFGLSSGWHTSSVAKILSNEAVLGKFQPHKIARGKRVPEGPAVRDYFPRIIGEQLFLRAQHARLQRQAGGGGRKGLWVSNLFTGLVKCAYCDAPMQFTNKGPGTKGGKYLTCDHVRRGLGCDNVSWRYDDFEASFLAFVREMDLNRILNTELAISKPEESDDQTILLESKKALLQQRRDKIFELIDDPTKPIPWIREKLRECETDLAVLDEQLTAAKSERTSAELQVSSFNDGKEQIKRLIEKFRQPRTNDLYRLRSQVASKLKSIVETIFVAGRGSAPYIQDALTFIRSSKDDWQEHLASLEGGLEGKDTQRRYFTVRFKNGVVRIVIPSNGDPLRSEKQLHGSSDALRILEPGQKTKKLIHDPKLTELVTLSQTAKLDSA